MRKVFLHLFIAFTTFFFSLELTRLFDSSTSTEWLPPQQNVEVVTVDVATVDVVNFTHISDEQKLLQIYREYGPAKTRHDRAFFERVESENFILFLRDRNMTREKNIRWMESWPLNVVYDYEVESIKIVGDSAVVTGRMQAHYPDGAVGSLGFIDVCVRNVSGWQILRRRLE